MAKQIPHETIDAQQRRNATEEPPWKGRKKKVGEAGAGCWWLKSVLFARVLLHNTDAAPNYKHYMLSHLLNVTVKHIYS